MSIRADKWLWYARFFKSRTLAAKMVTAKRLRVSGQVVDKAHHQVRIGDVLTFPQGRAIRVVKILELGVRRGPASEARGLYEDLKPVESRPAAAGAPEARRPGERPPGAGRPTKRERRQLERLKGDS